MTERDELLLKCDAGIDGLEVIGLSGQEAISEPFRFELQLRAPRDSAVPFEALVGRPLQVELRIPQRPGRIWHGIVTELSETGRDGRHAYYDAVLAPRLWLKTKIIRSRVFQDKTVPQILGEAVFADLDVELRLVEQYPPHAYCVQYRESDFDFASRLMEEEGLYYYFEHADGRHRMIVADRSSTSPVAPTDAALKFDDQAGGRHDGARVFRWKKTQQVQFNELSLRDYTFEAPKKRMQAGHQAPDTVQVGTVTHPLRLGPSLGIETHDLPGAAGRRFDDIDMDGKDRGSQLESVLNENRRLARIRMEAASADSLTIRAESDAAPLTPGCKFKLAEHHNADGDYLLTRVEHSVRQTGDADGDEAYSNRFGCIPLSLPYRPRFDTPRPTIAGTQTATVVGFTADSNGQIFTDKFGRVKVRFHWDRSDADDATRSCWLRVAQPWAGQGWGSMYIPRVGQEVVVAFEEGDPDAPIVLGSVYNADQTPPYPLPEQASRSGFMTQTNDGSPGSVANHSELRFDDSRGKEQVLLHSERNLVTRAENDHGLHVGSNYVVTVGVPATAREGTETRSSEKADSDGRGSGDDSGSGSESGNGEEEEGQKIEAKYDILVNGTYKEVVKGSKTEETYGNISETLGKFTAPILERKNTWGLSIDTTQIGGEIKTVVGGGVIEVVASVLDIDIVAAGIVGEIAITPLLFETTLALVKTEIHRVKKSYDFYFGDYEQVCRGGSLELKARKRAMVGPVPLPLATANAGKIEIVADETLTIESDNADVLVKSETDLNLLADGSVKIRNGKGGMLKLDSSGSVSLSADMGSRAMTIAGATIKLSASGAPSNYIKLDATGVEIAGLNITNTGALSQSIGAMQMKLNAVELTANNNQQGLAGVPDQIKLDATAAADEAQRLSELAVDTAKVQLQAEMRKIKEDLELALLWSTGSDYY